MKDYRLLFYLLTIIFVIVSFGLLNHHLQYKVLAQNKANSQDDKARSVAKGTGKDISISVTPRPEQAINDYVRTIFGGNGNVAVAVSHAECSPSRSDYPKCGPLVTKAEYSCGIFQINLRAHWNKVPVGNTFEEKCAYLQNPYNNTLVAKSIFADSGWYPWSAFTSGRYLNEL